MSLKENIRKSKSNQRIRGNFEEPGSNLDKLYWKIYRNRKKNLKQRISGREYSHRISYEDEKDS